MTKSKSTKRSLLASILAMMLCVAMLVCSTFAWFTDSVTSANNKIVAGNLDVELKYSTDGENWEDVNADTNMFDEKALWEPGYTEVVYLQVKNAGSLALKYQFGINVVDETPGTNMAGDKFNLSDYIKFGVVEASTVYDDRASARNAVKDNAVLVSAGYSSQEGHLAKDEVSNTIALVVYMPEEVGNEANYRGTEVPEITLGVNLVATQDTVESDSFDKYYDKDATLDFIPVSTAKGLNDAIKNATPDETVNISLSDDITLDTLFLANQDSDANIPLNDILIQGNGHTITTESEKARAMRIEGVDSNKTVTVVNTNIELTNTNIGSDKDQRGISLYNTSNVTINLIDCNITLEADDYSYAVNITSNCHNLTLNISNCKMTSANVINCWSNDSVINIDNCVLTSNYHFSDKYHGVCIANKGICPINVKNTVFNGSNAEAGYYNDLGGNIVNTSVDIAKL